MELTEEYMAYLRANLNLCNPLVQSLVARLDRVEGERLELKATIDFAAAVNRGRMSQDAILDRVNEAARNLMAYENTALRERVKRMEEAFIKYGRHQKDCPCASWIFEKPECTCGYEDTLKEGE